MHITILAIGTRGDVQPYIALGLGLQESGHQVRLVAADFFKGFIEDWGLDFFPINTYGLLNAGGEVHTTISKTIDRAGQLRQFWTNFRALLPAFVQTQESVWQASQGSQAIIFSSIGTSAYHVAEELEVPCIWALTVPMFGRTRAYANPLLPAIPLGQGYNLLTYTFVERFWRQILGRLSNSWRKAKLDLPPIPLHQWPYNKLHGKRVPMLYCYSPLVSPKPPDWNEQFHVTGYWFLDHPSGWQPPADLVRFLDSGPAPVYVGFGSMVSRKSEETTRITLGALKQSGQRGVIATGWGALSQSHLPDEVFLIESVPHDWLFPRMAAVVHHGGAGTVGAGLRAGVPNIVVPFGGDQPFWARRVQSLRVGPDPIPRKSLTAARLAHAIQVAVTDEPMRTRALKFGQRINAEDGVGNAVRIFNQIISDNPVGA
jgi:sterol 3beta-glucosyltransferase